MVVDATATRVIALGVPRKRPATMRARLIARTGPTDPSPDAFAFVIFLAFPSLGFFSSHSGR